MCGISGFLANDPNAPGDLDVVRRLNRALVHRGPDAEGLWSHGPCALGHRRLSIIDLSAEANQPILNEDGTVAVVVNGEIYNFVALRDELIAKGHTFRSHTDSEVVAHLYEEHGADCIARLHGMFAIALYDAKKRELLLARDRAGKKPLYYRITRRGLAFASEVHALVTAFPEERAEADLGAIDEYLELNYVPSPRTAFVGTYKLEPGRMAVFSSGELPKPVRYWRKPDGPLLTGSSDELAMELRRLLTEAVKRRLVADVPLGAFLSGGVDSSSIVALMATQSTRAVKTFSIGFPQADYTETEYARLVAKRFQTDHHEMTVTSGMVDVVPQIVHHHGEPFADSSSLATYYLAKMTREHVTVALSGDAGDENFAGYKRYNIARLGHLYDALPHGAQGLFQSAVQGFCKVFYPYVGRYAARMNEGEAARYVILVGQYNRDEKRQIYTERMMNARSNETVARFERILSESTAASPMGKIADLDWNTYMVDDINAKVDIAAMTHALEVRCPLLDTEVVEFASRLPGDMLMRFRGKYLLRKSMRGLVPWSVLYRTKRGFGIPLEHWMRHDLQAMIRDVLLDKTARERGLFQPEYVQKLVDGLSRRGAYTDRVWTLLVLELWFREFIDGAKSN